MPYEVADRGRPCPPTLPIEYARESNATNDGNSLQQGQQSVNTSGQGVNSSCDRENRPASQEIHIEPDESLVKSHGQEVSSKRSFGGHTLSGGGGDSSAASSFRSKRRSWHRRPRHGPYRPRGHTFDSHTTSSAGPNANNTSSKTNEPMDQENSSENKNKWFRHRLRKPYAAPPCNTTQFLMDDHNFRERDFEEVDKLLRESPFARPLTTSPPSGAESDEFYSSPDDENEFQQRQFSQVYEYVHAERLSSMSKSELVQEYILLEEKVEDLEKKLKDAKSALSEVSRKREIESSELSNLREQVILLTNENNRLLNISQQPSQQQPQQSQQQPQQPAVTSISSTSITSSDSPGQTL